MFRSVGTLRYSPKALGDKASPNWWLILDCDRELGRYYRHLYYLSNHKCHQLMRPACAEHVTVIRNEEPADQFKHLWEKYDNQEVEFLLRLEAETDGRYVWLPVECSFVLEIRAELGLSREPEIPLHLSIGHGGS